MLVEELKKGSRITEVILISGWLEKKYLKRLYNKRGIIKYVVWKTEHLPIPTHFEGRKYSGTYQKDSVKYKIYVPIFPKSLWIKKLKTFQNNES